jgi:DNA-binding winged helix-turn-helix (wHTH) protein
MTTPEFQDGTDGGAQDALFVASVIGRDTLAVIDEVYIGENGMTGVSLDAIERAVKTLNPGKDETVMVWARTKFVVKDHGEQEQDDHCIEYFGGGLQIFTDGRSVVVDGVERRATKQHYDILLFLAQNPGKVMTYGEIAQECWGNPRFYSVPNISHQVRLIRKGVLGEKYRGAILTYPGTGWKFDPDFMERSDTETPET